MKRNSRTSQSIRTLKFTTGRTFTLSQETGVYTSHVPYITSNAMLLLVLNEKRFVTQFSVTRFPTHSSRTVTASMTQCNKHDVFPVRTGVNSMIVWHCAQASGSVDPSTDIFKRGSRSPPPHTAPADRAYLSDYLLQLFIFGLLNDAVRLYSME